MIAGMGTISTRNARGKRTARSIRQPEKKTTTPAIRRISDVRDRNSSAPKTPRINVHKDSRMIGSPQFEGSGVIDRKRPLSCQITNAENRGTKKPCEKL